MVQEGWDEAWAEAEEEKVGRCRELTRKHCLHWSPGWRS